MFQFVRSQTYGRKAGGNARNRGATAQFVLDEAERKPHACPHVDEPQEPHVVHGMSVADVRKRHERMCEEARTATSRGHERKVRTDQHTLLAEVASHPYSATELRADKAKLEEYRNWRRDTVAWWKERLGTDLVSIVEHRDENHMHLHAFALPLSDPEAKAKNLHPGFAAQEAEKRRQKENGVDAKTARKMGDRAYKDAMRSFQDRFSERVGLQNGMARIGPRVRRKTRAEWQKEQKGLEAVRKLHRLHTVAKRATGKADKARKAAEEAKARAEEDAQRAKREALETARKRAVERGRLEGQGQARREARQEVHSELAQLRADLEAERDARLAEEQGRLDAEQGRKGLQRVVSDLQAKLEAEQTPEPDADEHEFDR
jgi:hypothetical protein